MQRICISYIERKHTLAEKSHYILQKLHNVVLHPFVTSIENFATKINRFQLKNDWFSVILPKSGGGGHLHSCVVICEQCPTDQTHINTYIFNVELWPLITDFQSKKLPFSLAVYKYTPFSHASCTNDHWTWTLNTDFLPFLAHLPDFVTLIAVHLSVQSVWKTYHFPCFFLLHIQIF